MTTARDIMSESTECAQITETVSQAAQKMRDLGVGALPICGEDNRLQGMITDRDIVVKTVADGTDPSQATVQDFAGDEVVTIGADDSIDEALATMSKAGVRRLPVIDGHDLVGMISQADIAKNLPDEKVADFLESISSAPDND
jgi:CBS domain-containing protein